MGSPATQPPTSLPEALTRAATGGWAPSEGLDAKALMNLLIHELDCMLLLEKQGLVVKHGPGRWRLTPQGRMCYTRLSRSGEVAIS